jgi:hypothetical protein
MYWNIQGQKVGTNDIVEVNLQDELELESDEEKYTFETESEFLF